MSHGRTVADVTCLRCGCTCDDLIVSVENERVVGVQVNCEIARDWFSHVDQSRQLAAYAYGDPVEAEAAVDAAVSILSQAKSPAIWGLTRTVTETVRASLALADRLKARVILDRSSREQGRVSAFQDNGGVTATLGEVKNRADLVVFWGVDPVVTHPRHWERYSVDPIGRFIPGGRAGRQIVVVDSQRTATAEAADLFIEVPSHLHVEVFTALRMLLRGKPIDPHASAIGGGPNLAALTQLIEQMKAARYGSLFYEAGDVIGGGSSFEWEGAIRLVRELNEFTRFVLLGMGAPGNLDGAESALAWQSGFLQGVDYRLGKPAPLDDHATLEDAVKRKEIDAIVAVADNFPPEASSYLNAIPSVAIGPTPFFNWKPLPTVFLPTSTAGFDTAGTVSRSDGVILPLRPIVEPCQSSDRQWIEQIAERLSQSSGGIA